MRLVGVLVVTPNEDDFAPILADTNPSAASPRLSSSHTADALLGIRFLKRKSSRARNSSASSMICRRSGRNPFDRSVRARTHKSGMVSAVR
jgi:hypothetical protein